MGKIPRKVTAYLCNICEELYMEEDEAVDCCCDDKNPEKEGWQCVKCDDIHEEREDAYRCCE